MKLKEYGYIIWQLSQEISTEQVGLLAWRFSNLVEDWDVDADIKDNRDWILEKDKDEKK